MIFEVHLLSQPQKYFKRVPVNIAKKMVKCFLTLEKNPYKSSNIKKVQGYKNLYRYRIGSIRVVYEVLKDENIVVVQTILPRGDIYKKI